MKLRQFIIFATFLFVGGVVKAQVDLGPCKNFDPKLFQQNKTTLEILYGNTAQPPTEHKYTFYKNENGEFDNQFKREVTQGGSFPRIISYHINPKRVTKYRSSAVITDGCVDSDGDGDIDLVEEQSFTLVGNPGVLPLQIARVIEYLDAPGRFASSTIYLDQYGLRERTFKMGVGVSPTADVVGIALTRFR